MSIISVENLTKSYGEKTLFDHISFTISEKERIGLIGVNGTGKSTLLKVIAGLDTGEKGEIVHAKKFQIEYLAQYPELNDELTVLEQIYYGESTLMKTLRDYERAVLELSAEPANLKKQKQFTLAQQKMEELDAWEANTKAKTVLSQLGITNYNQPVKELSGGLKKRVAIAKALLQPADLLILDEPTNHLDNEVIEWLESYLAQYQGALLVVTHDRYFLNRVTNRILELSQGRLYSYDGNYEAYLQSKTEREEREVSVQKKRKNFLRRELEWLRRGAKARSTKQKYRKERVEEMMSQKTQKKEGKIEMVIGASRLGKKVLELKKITKSYEGKNLISDLSYLVRPDERLGIIGNNGAGKTTLLNIMAGNIKPDQGSVEIGQTVKFGYYTQDYKNMNPELRVIEYLREGADNIQTANGQVITAEQILERFLFPRTIQRTYIRKLSGGERRRLYLLRVLLEKPNVLLLDEPTNDLDIQTLSILEDYLETFPGAVVTVSHDRYFLDRVVEHLLVFEGEGKVRLFTGTYTEYLEARKLQEAEKTANKEKKLKKNSAPQKNRPQKLSYKEQKEWEEIEDKIAELERRNAQLQQEISTSGSDYESVQKLYKEQLQIEEELEEAIERWTELSIKIEEMKLK